MIASVAKYFSRSLHLRPFWVVFPNQLKLLPKRERMEVRLRNGGGTFMVRPNTRDINEVLAVGLGYEYPPALFDALPPHSTLIDCGAHIGTFAVFVALRNPTCTIAAIEPEDHNCALLEENITRNGLSDRVKVCHGAVAPHDGNFELRLSNTNNGHSLTQPMNEGRRSQPTRGYSLGGIVAQHCPDRPYAVKMDIEGAEYDVLPQSRPAIEHALFVVMEWHVANQTKAERWGWLTDYFRSLGFEGHSIHESRWGGVALWEKRR